MDHFLIMRFNIKIKKWKDSKKGERFAEQLYKAQEFVFFFIEHLSIKNSNLSISIQYFITIVPQMFRYLEMKHHLSKALSIWP